MISVTIERARGLGWPVDATDRVSVMDAERAMRDLSDYDRSRWSPRE